MRQFRHHAWQQSRSRATILAAFFSPVALLLPAIVAGAGSAAAAPAAGYTASLILTGQKSISVAVNPLTDTVYLADPGVNEISVVDGSTNAVTGTIALSGPVARVAVNPVTDTVYVLRGGATPTDPNAVDVIDGATRTITATVTLPAASEPNDIAVDSATNTLYVVETAAAAVAVVSGSTNMVTATVSSGISPFPEAIAVDETSDVVWVSTENGVVQAIDGTSKSVIHQLSFSSNADSVAVNPVSDTVYAAIEGSGIAVIDGATGTLRTTVALTTPLAEVAVDPGSGTVFASSYLTGAYGTTWVIDSGSNSVADTIARGGEQVAVDTETGAVYEALGVSSLQQNGAWSLTPSAANAWSPEITSGAATLTVGQAGSFTIVASALPAATFTESGALPAWVTLSPSGILSGTPAAGTGGTYPLTITASNGIAPDYSRAFRLIIRQAPTIAPLSNTTVRVGTPVSIPVQVTGFPAPTVGASNLPAGLEVTSPTAGQWQLAGTPAAGTGGSYPITVTAANSAGTATTAFTLTVDETPAITVAGQATFHAGAAGSFTVTATGFPAPTFSETGALPHGVTLDSNGVLSGTPAAGTAGIYPILVTATNALGTATQAFTLTVDAGASFVPAGPLRVLDTRDGTGGFNGPVGPNSTISLQITGRNGVPSTGVTAVVLNITATDSTDSSFVTVFPDGTTRPTASNLNFTAGETIPNLITVPVGADGMVDLYNHAGSVSLIADLAGYYTTSTGSSFAPIAPTRLLDTRNGTGGFSAPVGPNGTISVQITGPSGAPSSATAVVLNVTATGPTASSYVTVYPDGTARPTASSLNFTAGETIPNLVIVPLGADGKVDFYNHTGSVSLVADLAGYYTTSGTGSSFVPAGPVRVLDTRNGTGGVTNPVGPNGTISLQVTGSNGVPASGVTAVVLNVTATGPTAASFVTVWPDGITRPTASNLNFTSGETIPNLVVVPVGADGKVDLYNFAGSVNLVADLAGYYTSP